MTPYMDDGQVTLYQGHVLDVLRELPDESVQCVVTSPPYWAKMAYGTMPQTWADGWVGELGLESSHTQYIDHLLSVFAQVQRVIRQDGVCFVNIADTYAADHKQTRPDINVNWGIQSKQTGSRIRDHIGRPDGLKPKDLALVPERFAIAMQEQGWYVRSRIAWCKTAPRMEEARDRPVNAWEHLFMFTRAQRYFWNADEAPFPGKRQLWSYWTIGPEQEPGAHFATFPSAIPRRCIAAATGAGDTVLDPFVGSGTTCRVARSMLRRSVGIELNERYLSEIAMRDSQMALMTATSKEQLCRGTS